MINGAVKSATWLVWLTLFVLLFYLRGFLLTKTEIEKDSECRDYAHAACWSAPRYKRAILVLVDALRHDFTIYNTSVKHPAPWQNKMPIFSELRSRFPNKTRHLEFIADPPTATFLRLKGLTTGGLPTFVDMGSNFGASEITEDSWVKQLALNDKKLVFLGDDTWINLYSKHFHRSFPYPSFDVWDLHTVDNGVWKHLIPQIQTSDWDVIVAHFLGVDHAGHRYHVNHPELSDKLSQVNGWVGEIVDNVDDDTVLFVFGDHGMTTSGDHGGESRDEVTATLFVYSGSEFGELRKEEQAAFDPGRVYQTDIVPTLTMLLGVPIPYSSLGNIIPFLFLTDDVPDSRISLQQVLNTNMNQVFRYIAAYSMISNEFGETDIAAIRAQVADINARYVASSTEYSLELAKEMQQMIGRIRDLCSQHWAQFDLPIMILAVVIMLSLALALIIIPELSPSWWNAIPIISVIIISYEKLSIWSGVTHPITVLLTITTIVVTLYNPLKTGLCGIFCKEGMLHILGMIELPDLAGLVICVIVSVGFTTNSYILVEDYITIFFFGTLLLINFLQQYRQHGLKLEELLLTGTAVTMSRLSAVFFGCREEQFWCTKTWWLSDDIEGELQSYRYMFSVCLFLATMYGVYWYQKREGSLVCRCMRVIHCIIHPVQCILVVVYWALSSSPAKVLTETQQCWLPRVVYILTFITICAVLYNPATVHLVNATSNTNSNKPKLYGCVSCYSSPALALYATTLPSCALLLQHSMSPVLALLTLQLFCLARLLCSRSTVFKVAVCHVVMLQYFYATGHQAAVQQFDWNAAFVGFTTHPNHVVPVFMIIVRTLMSCILVTLFLPTVLLQTSAPAQGAHEIDMTRPENTAQLQYYINGRLLRDKVHWYVNLSTALVLFKCLWACVACFIHRRHLMIWNIFTPRMVIEMCFTACTGVVTLFVVLFLSRNDVKLRGYLDKLCKSG